MLREWVSEKVSRIRMRLEHHEFSETAQSTSAGTSANSSTSKRRSKSDGRKASAPTMVVSSEKFTPKQAAIFQLQIRDKMQYYYYRDNLYDIEVEVEACPLCTMRWARIQCFPCDHSKICRFCAYDMLTTSRYPINDDVVCGICSKLVTGFIKKREENDSNLPIDENDNKSPIEIPEGEQSISLEDFAWNVIKNGWHKYHENKGFEPSNSGGSSGSSSRNSSSGSR